MPHLIHSTWSTWGKPISAQVDQGWVIKPRSTWGALVRPRADPQSDYLEDVTLYSQYQFSIQAEIRINPLSPTLIFSMN